MPLQLDLTLRHAEGALLRVLGLTERRGFRVLTVQAAADEHAGIWRVQLTVSGTRNPHTLQQQLGKLFDCLAVEVREAPPPE